MYATRLQASRRSRLIPEPRRLGSPEEELDRHVQAAPDVLEDGHDLGEVELHPRAAVLGEGCDQAELAARAEDHARRRIVVVQGKAVEQDLGEGSLV